MGKSLSLDIRERIVALVNEGLSCREVARRLQISVASAVRIMQRKKQTGGVTAAPQGSPAQQAGCRLGLAQGARGGEIRHHYAGTELADEMEARHGPRATPAMLSRHLIHRLGFTYSLSKII